MTKKENKSDIFSLILKVSLIGGLCVLILTFLFGFNKVKDNNMNPNIKAGDLVLFNRIDKDCKARDLIAIKENDGEQIRRVIAVEGDTVDMTHEGRLKVNGYVQSEDYIYTDTYAYTDGITFPITVGKDQVFVLSDNRTNGNDSRIYGCVDKNDVKGKVITIIYRRFV